MDDKARQHMLSALIIILLILCGFSSFYSFPVDYTRAVPIDWNWTIENNTVYINNSWAYLSASPHTIGSSGWVEFELESKVLSGNIDSIWGFNSSEAKPQTPQIWRNYTHNLTGRRWVEQYLNKSFWVLSSVNLGIENYDSYDVDFGNKNNTKLWNLSCAYYEELDETWYNYSVVIAFTSQTSVGANYIFYYYDEVWQIYYYDSMFFDWKTFGGDITVVNHNWKEFNKWYIVNAMIQADHRYKMRCWIDIPFGGLEGTSGKYVWALKEHSKTMYDAISSGMLVYLDPWWDGNWDRYRTITIESDDIITNLYNFPVLVVFDNLTFNIDNNKSIRFVAGSNSGGTDNVTEYAYEIEKWNDVGNCYIWVNVTEVYASSDTVFNMYYNNSAATDNQNPTGVWDSNYVAVYHMDDVGDSTSYNKDGTNQGSTSSVNGKTGNCRSFDGNNDWIDIPNNILPNANAFSISGWLKCIGDNGDPGGFDEQIVVDLRGQYQIFTSFKEDDDGLNPYEIKYDIYDGSEHSLYSNTKSYSTWYHYTAVYDGTNMHLYVNGTEEPAPTATNAPSVTTDDSKIGKDYGVIDRLWFFGDLDEIRISKNGRNASWVKASYHTQNQTTGFLTFGLEQGWFIVINATTGIEETNATLHGYIYGNGSGNYNYGFWVGTTTPLTEGNADHNMTGSGYVTATGNRDFSHNDTNLTQGIHYYVRAWVSNATHFDSSVNEEDFWTKCDAPSGFTATVSGCNVNLAWTKGTGADKTTIVRNVDSYPANQTDGTVVYNDSGVSYSDTSGSGSHQYYRAWSWVGDKHSDGNVSANISVPPCPPTNVDTNVLSNNTFDIVWTKGVGAVNTVVRRKLNSRPSSVTDGIQVYNDTGTQINIQSILNYYYSLWSYANITYSSQVNITVGGLVLKCYDEETNDSLWFDVFISNQDGSQTYESLNNSNPLILNISQLPVGDDVKITVSAASNYSDKSETSTGYPPDENYTITYVVLLQTPDSKSSTNVTCINEGDDAHSYPSFTLDDDLITILPDNADKFTKIFVNYTHEEYSSRLYYRDISESSFSFLNIYLPPTENKQLYLLEVIDEAGNTVSDVYIEVKRSVNGTFVVVSRLLTDANGQADIDLISDKDYIFIISKTGYITENASWTPGTEIFTHTFKIIWETTPFEPDTFGDIISFYGTLYVNNTMMVTFYDLDDVMSNSHFIIYEDYNDTLTYMGEYNGTTSNDIVFWINVDNATRLHIIILFMNHSTLGEVINYRIVVYPVHVDRDEGNWLENLIQGVVGNFDYGYVITFIWYLPCVLLIAGLAAIGHPGIGILGAGFYSIWITWYLFIPEEAKILTFASIALVTGSITLFLVKGKKVIH